MKQETLLRSDTRLAWYEKGMNDLALALSEFDNDGCEIDEDVDRSLHVIMRMLIDKQKMQIDFSEQLAVLQEEKK